MDINSQDLKKDYFREPELGKKMLELPVTVNDTHYYTSLRLTTYGKVEEYPWKRHFELFVLRMLRLMF